MTDVIRALILPKFDRVRPTSGGFMVQCPAHSDGTASLKIAYGQKHPVVFNCFAGCERGDVLAALDLTWEELCDAAERQRPEADPWGWMPCVKREGHSWTTNYIYRDQHGTPVFGVARCDRKCFGQFRIDPTAKMGRVWGLTLPDGTKAGEGLIYRLPEVLDSDATLNVYVVEGERDVHTLDTLGVLATCNSAGAGKWTPQHAEWLVGRDVIIVADRDDAGWKHAETVANTLLGGARSVEVVRAAVGKDVSDHVAAGLTLGKLVQVAEPKPAPALTPAGSDQ